jgi:putative transcriptional regulator
MPGLAPMTSLQGKLLVSSPKLVDPNFFHTVVLIVQHNEDGALGLVLNRPLQTSVREMWDEVGESDCGVEGVLHQGGPCEGPLMVLHTDEDRAEMVVGGGMYFCTSRERIEKLIDGQAAHTKFFVGYAGWTAGQLESEMGEGSWLTAPANIEAVFDGDEHLWTDLVRAISRAAVTNMVDPKRIPDDPSVN